MSAAELQACLSRLYVDDAFRRLLEVDPAYVLDRYRLTPDEQQTVRDLDRKSLDFFADSLRAKRRMRLANAFPRLFGGRVPSVEACYERYHDLFPERQHVHPFEDVRLFGRFALETHEADGAVWLADLIRYSLMLVQTRLAPPESDSRRLTDDACPRLAADAAFDTFRSDVLAVVRTFDAGDDPSVFPEEENVLALKGTTPITLNPPVRAILEQCDGRTPCAAIAPSRNARAALQSLVDLGVLVTTVPAAAATLPDPTPEGH